MVEIGMLVVETVVRIRREHAAGKAIKAIARDLKLSRKVVRKAVRAPEGAFSYKRRVQPAPKIGPFQERAVGVAGREREASAARASADDAGTRPAAAGGL